MDAVNADLEPVFRADPAAPQAVSPAPGEHAPRIGLIRNPRSHRNRNHPLETVDPAVIRCEAPTTHAALSEVLAEFSRDGIEYLAVDGGDGTVRDVLTCGQAIWGAGDWPTLIVVPKGKTNALAVDLGLPQEWSLTDALAAVKGRGRVERAPLLITPEDPARETVLGFFLGSGVFTLSIDAGQDAHRLGAFNSFAVGLAIGWSIVQVLFGGKANRWRAATPMDLRRLSDGAPLPHGPHGAMGERFLMVATTFERFPLGLKPFGDHVAPGIKVGLIDSPVRRVMALVPGVLLGAFPGFLARNGAHRVVVDGLDMTLGGSFIIDGEAYPAGRYRLEAGPRLRFVTP